MFKMGVTVTNLLPVAIPEARRRAARRVKASAVQVAEFIQAGMLQSKSGRLYKSRGIVHQASAPYEYPAVEPQGFSETAGDLVASIKVTDVDYSDPDRPSCDVYTDVPYAVDLEVGTAKMAPRPFFSAAADKARPVVARQFENYFNSDIDSESLQSLGDEFSGRAPRIVGG